MRRASGPSGAESLRPTNRTGRSTASLMARAEKIGASANRRALTTISAPLRRGRCWSPPTETFQRSCASPMMLRTSAGVTAPVVDHSGRFVDEVERQIEHAPDGCHGTPTGIDGARPGHHATARRAGCRMMLGHPYRRSMTSEVVDSGTTPEQLGHASVVGEATAVQRFGDVFGDRRSEQVAHRPRHSPLRADQRERQPACRGGSPAGR